MPYENSTTLLGPSRSSAAAYLEWATTKGAARLPDVALYLDTSYDLAPSTR